MKYELNDSYRNIPDQELLDDLKKVAMALRTERLKKQEYNEAGRFSAGTFERRFGTWKLALEKIGIHPGHQRGSQDEELLQNIEEVWLKLGRQPLRQEIKYPLSKYSSATYERRFGNWRKSLEAFIEYINKAGDEQPLEKTDATVIEKEIVRHKTKRSISSRLKVQVLMRDGNKCKLCGIIVTGEDIHIDHIIPWSKGGESVLENLQVLCVEHNLAKGNWMSSEQKDATE